GGPALGLVRHQAGGSVGVLGATLEEFHVGAPRRVVLLGMNQWLPEWPKPPAPRWLSSNCSTSSKCACTTGTSTSCAMRSPMAMVTGVWPRFQHDTISSPW